MNDPIDFRELNPELIYVSEDAWNELQEMLARPPTPVPALVELFRRRSVLENPDPEE